MDTCNSVHVPNSSSSWTRSPNSATGFFPKFCPSFENFKDTSKATCFLQRIIGTRKLRCHMDGTFDLPPRYQALWKYLTEIRNKSWLPQHENWINRTLKLWNSLVWAGCICGHMWWFPAKKMWQCWDDKKNDWRRSAGCRNGSIPGLDKSKRNFGNV